MMKLRIRRILKSMVFLSKIKNLLEGKDDVLFVVYTERVRVNDQGKQFDVTRIISARYATNFERGLYYGKY